MDETEKLIFGFRRVKTVYENCPFDWDVFSWFTNSEKEKNAPILVKLALEKLDALADNWPAIDRLEWRIGSVHPELTRQLLGLDFDTRRQRLRAAVGRACMASWRYADVYCDWRDAYQEFGEVLAATEDFITKWGLELDQLAKVREKTGFLSERPDRNPWPSDLVMRSIDDLWQFIEGTKRWAEGAERMAQRFPKDAPRIFLYLRLSEIFTCFSGSVPPFHLTRKYTDNPRNREMNFLAFLEPALTVIGYPGSDGTGADKVMRDIKNYIENIGRFEFLSRLTDGEIDCFVRRLDYPDFPSIDLHNGLNCFSDTDL